MAPSNHAGGDTQTPPRFGPGRRGTPGPRVRENPNSGAGFGAAEGTFPFYFPFEGWALEGGKFKILLQSPPRSRAQLSRDKQPKKAPTTPNSRSLFPCQQNTQNLPKLKLGLCCRWERVFFHRNAKSLPTPRPPRMEQKNLRWGWGWGRTPPRSGCLYLSHVSLNDVLLAYGAPGICTRGRL